MYLKSILTAAICVGAATSAQAAPVDVLSTITMSNSWVINGGNAPAGIDTSHVPGSFEIDRDAASFVDSPTVIQSENIHVQVGNPYTDPPLAAEGSWNDVTVDLATANFARGLYSTSVTTEDYGEHSSFDPVRRSTTQDGLAVLSVADGDVAASASAQETSARGYTFENTTDDLISFNIAGLFEAELLASASSLGGVAHASAGFGMVFDAGIGASVNYFAIDPYTPSIEESGSGATITEELFRNSGGILGVSFNATASAISQGDNVLASFAGDNRYIFGLSLDPGATITMSMNHYQFNAVEFDPDADVPTVPLPGSAILLLGGLLAMTRLKPKSA